MKVLVLSWEFPPRIVGGLARHVAELYPELVKQGHEIHLLTINPGWPHLIQESTEGIQVYRLPIAESGDFLGWVGEMNLAMGDFGGELLARIPLELIHAHDWLVADAAIALKQRFGLPLVATIHATERGRQNGLSNALQFYIHGKEQSLVAGADRIIACSQFMRQEVIDSLAAAPDRVRVIYNGIRPDKKPQLAASNRRRWRQLFAAEDQAIVYFVGRLTYEKGIAVFIDAMPQVLERGRRKVRFLIVGGGDRTPWEQQVAALGLQDICHFTGFLSEEELDQFQTLGDCAVFPSLYEPFGIVALEAFASRVPVVASNAGGLPEVVQHGKTGWITQQGNATDLANGILMVLEHPEQTEQWRMAALRDLAERFSWPKLALETEQLYSELIRREALQRPNPSLDQG
jgi:glycosyltransferase involved in cell wall biosynthesis